MILFANHHFIGYFDSVEHINVVEKQAEDEPIRQGTARRHGPVFGRGGGSVDRSGATGARRHLPLPGHLTNTGLFHRLNWWCMVRILALWRRFEGPTWALAVVIYGGWGLLTWCYSVLSWWLVLPLGAWLIAWQMSLQHEL